MPLANLALIELGRSLLELGYSFTTVTPATHSRVLKRGWVAQNVRDVFGWNLPFAPEALPAHVHELAERAEVLERCGEQWRSRVRFASLGERLFVHGAYPTTSPDAVFFGPDSYRFCRFLEQQLRPCKHLVDVGCGSGVGGISASVRAESVSLTDINPMALKLTRVNAALAGISAQVFRSDILDAVDAPIDAIVANPPYMRDAAGRTYRDGGGTWGEALSLRIVRQALERLQPGGQLLLYTGVAVVDGVDVFQREVTPLCRQAGATLDYFEIDPDVFGEELEEPAYASVERIAAVGLRAVVR